MSHDYTGFVEEAVPTEDSLKNLVRLTGMLRDQRQKVEDIEELLKVEKAKLTSLEEIEIPRLMEDVGVPKLTLPDGTPLEITDDLFASIAGARNAQAIAWLDEHGYAGLVKRRIVVSFSKEEAAKAEALLAELTSRDARLDISQENKVEPSTLKAWAKRAIEAGEAVPFETFGIYIKKRAKIGTGKTKRGASAAAEEAF